MIWQATTDSGTVLIPVVRRAAWLGARLKGLLGRRGLPEGEALHIIPCPGIHTFGMQFDLDVVFLARDSSVVRVVAGVKPWRVVQGWVGAHSVLEMQAGWADLSRFRLDRVVKFVACP